MKKNSAKKESVGNSGKKESSEEKSKKISEAQKTKPKKSAKAEPKKEESAKEKAPDPPAAPAEEQNEVYIKFKHGEGVSSKKDLLVTELSFLTILKIMKRYNLWREEELKLKAEADKKIRELDETLKKAQHVFPFIKIPENVRRKKIIELKPLEPVKEEKPEPKPVEETKPAEDDLEAQLMEIQKKLNSIGR